MHSAPFEAWKEIETQWTSQKSRMQRQRAPSSIYDYASLHKLTVPLRSSAACHCPLQHNLNLLIMVLMSSSKFDDESEIGSPISSCLKFVKIFFTRKDLSSLPFRRSLRSSFFKLDDRFIQARLLNVIKPFHVSNNKRTVS